MDREIRRLERERLRLGVLARLDSEGETDLAGHLRRCHQPFPFLCVNCGMDVEGKTRCKRKWCPHCSAAIARERNVRLTAAVSRFRFPLFITLTMKNVDDLNLGAVRQLRRAFGKLRHQKFWRSCVKGGVACIEVTNTGNGWHPHLHAVVDSAWLSAQCVRQPGERKKKVLQYNPSWSRQQKALEFKAAASSVERVWARLLKQPSASIKIKRTSAKDILREVVKYTVKGSQLQECSGKIGPLIRAIDATRMMTTFGTAYRLSKLEVRTAAKQIAERNNPTSNKSDSTPEPDLTDTDTWGCGCSAPELIPREVFDAGIRRMDADAWRGR